MLLRVTLHPTDSTIFATTQLEKEPPSSWYSVQGAPSLSRCLSSSTPMYWKPVVAVSRSRVISTAGTLLGFQVTRKKSGSWSQILYGRDAFREIFTCTEAIRFCTVSARRASPAQSR